MDENKRKKRITRKIARLFYYPFAGIVIVCFIVLVVVIAGKIKKQKNNLNNISTQVKVNGQVLAEADANTGGFKSENYNVPQISFGGAGTVFFPTDEEQRSLAIDNMTSAIFADKNKIDKKLLVSWNTTKQARCTLSYSKTGAPSEDSYQEGKFDYNHSVLLTPLDSASTYNYIVTAKDKWGNEIQSDKFAVYTGAQEVSLLDLIAGAFRDVFGWALR